MLVGFNESIHHLCSIGEEVVGEEECLDIVSAGWVHKEVEQLCYSVALVQKVAG